ncbi:MAG: TRAP transporter TatT component family protein [Gammaproteobacteria bacterium]|nr:TRAP transporter TatT component family protein [Gammaproteobacteria bacterium]
MKFALQIIGLLVTALMAAACASVMATAGSGLAGNLNTAILNQDDPVLVRDGAPAYLLMLDSFIEGDPNDSTMLLSASKLYSAYAGVFVKDAERAKRLTQKSLDFALTANCLESSDRCNLKSIDFNKFEKIILQYKKEQIEYLFTLGSSWAGWIQSHSDDWNAAADLARVTTIMNHALKLDERYQSGQIHLYLGVLNTLLPPALGGKPEVGKHHFETAILFSDNKNLMAKVIYAEKYARLMFKQELHDQLLNEVLKTEPRSKGFTLTNMLAHKQAKELLASGKDYF